MGDPKVTEQFSPAFSFGEPNRSVFIAEDEALIKDIDGTVLLSGNAEVRLDLLPRPRIHVYVTNKKELGFGIGNNAKILELTNHRCKIKGFTTTVNPSTSNGISLVWSPYSEPIIGVGNDTTEIQYVVFHLFNFKNILGTSRSWEQGDMASPSIEHVTLKADNWVVELKSLTESESNSKKLKKEGGCRLMHIGLLKKVDHTSFLGKEATEMLNALRYFFSFAKGAWCEPVCAVGFDFSGNRVWESWSSPTESSFSQLSWFDEHHSEQLEDLFPGFMRCWFDEDLNDTFHKVIYWYLNANNSKVDVGIILTQAALERLSFEYVVNVYKLKKAEIFTRLPAVDKIRSLFSNLDMDIPASITEHTPELKKLAEDFRWKDDALSAIILVRNSLVHPAKKYRGKFKSAMYYDTRNLGLWYLELSLLKLCEYSGTYFNRLTSEWIGQVENVPWKN
ncbi:TPA: hypothetical protein HA351_08535 [Methanosarcinaceae archaeon]|nr:hypothetical protein [Methanosarcinaceae archaeon]